MFRKVFKILAVLSILLVLPAHADITTGLVGWWKFDENSGSYAYDSSGQGTTGTLTNDATWIAGKRNTAVTFDGTDDHVDFGDPVVLDDIFDGSATVSLWVKRNVVGAYQMFLSKQENGGAFAGMVFATNNVNKDNAYFYLTNDGATQSLQLKSTDAVFPTAGVWYHLVITLDGTRTAAGVLMYVNGQSVALTTLADTLASDTSSTYSFYAANRISNLNALNGSIDDLRVYSRVLTPADVQELYIGLKAKLSGGARLGAGRF